MKFTFHSKVARVFKHEPVVRGRVVDGQAVLETENHGWFIAMEGSREALYVGDEEPKIAIGSAAKVTLEFQP